MARAAQGDRNRRGGRRARSADRGQRDPERDAPGFAGPYRARLRARDDGLPALSSEPARRAPRGAGRGSMARFIHQRMPRTRVTVVEIDPGVVNVARRYFHFPEEDARLGIVIGDGAQVVPQRPASCDVLVVDGFVNGSPARSLCTRSFYDGAFAALRPGGVMVANFMSDDKRIETHCGRIAESFGRGPTLLLAEEEDNYVAFALRGGPPRIRWTQLKARARAAQRLSDLPLDGCLADLRRRNSHTTHYLTL